jgi:3'-5' exoribonuclease
MLQAKESALAFLIDINKSLLPLCPLHKLENGQTAQTFALLAERTLNQTREGKPYYQCRFKDRLRTATLMVWLDSPWFAECEKSWKLGTAYRLAVTFGIHDKYGQQIDLLQIKQVAAEDKNDGYDAANLVESSRFAASSLWQQLLEFIDNEIERDPVKRLIRDIYDQFAERLQEIPATKGKFYPFRGGWLEHVHSLSISCLLLVEHFQRHYADVEPKLDRDLLLSGALLHDIGRVLEYKTDELGLIEEMTVPGKLFGHVILGRDLVRQAAQEQQGFPPDFLERLEPDSKPSNVARMGLAAFAHSSRSVDPSSRR